MDFTFSFKFRPESNAQTFFLQACLKYPFGKDIGNTGIDNDGVDGIFGHDTETTLNQVLTGLGITGGVTNAAGWKKFLLVCRERAFS